LLKNHEAAKIINESKSDYRTVTFNVALNAPKSMRGNGYGKEEDFLSYEVDIASAVARAMPTGEVPKTCFIENIEVMHARNLNGEDRSISVELTSPSVQSTYTHASCEGDDEAMESASALFVVPDGTTLSQLGSVYNASNFANTDTYKRYSKALDADVKEFTTQIHGTGLVSYVSPFSISSDERAKAVDLGQISESEPVAPETATDEQGQIVQSDWFLDIVFRNASAFKTPPTAAVRPSLKNDGEHVISFEMASEDYQELKKVVDKDVIAPLATHLIRLDGKSTLKFAVRSEQAANPEGRVTAWAKSTKFDSVMRITVAYVQ